MGRKHKTYTNYFDRLAKKSWILNPDQERPSGNIATLGPLLLAAHKTSKTQKLGFLREDLNLIERGYKISRQTEFNRGSEFKESATQKESRLEKEALADHTENEIKELEERIKNIKEKEKDAQAILPDGPIGNRSINANSGSGFADGQIVKVNEEGIPAICDKRSIWDGMTIFDYLNRIAKPWQEANRKKYLGLVKEWDEKKVKEQDRKSPRQVRVPWPDAKGRMNEQQK